MANLSRIADIGIAHSERHLCGLSGLVQVRRVLVQKSLAIAARLSLQCGPFRRCGHLTLLRGAESIPTTCYALPELEAFTPPRSIPASQQDVR